MGFFKDVKTVIKNEWTKLNGAEKCKIIARFVCGFGSGCICGVGARKYMESENPGIIEGGAVLLTSVGAAWALGEITSNAWDKTIDLYTDLKKEVADSMDEDEDEEVVG